MAYDLEEQEQLETLKAWWTRYGNWLSTIVIVAVVAWAGWTGWNYYKQYQASQAMGYFEALQRAAGSASAPNAMARVEAASQTLRQEYGSTGYASRGVLIAAAALEQNKQLDAARDQLQWVIGKSHASDGIRAVARLRLAGILLDQKQYDQALAQLQEKPPASFDSLYADRRGDILAAQGHATQAKAAWQQAIAGYGAGSSQSQVVQFKIDALNGA